MINTTRAILEDLILPLCVLLCIGITMATFVAAPVCYLKGSAISELMKAQRKIEIPWYRSCWLGSGVVQAADVRYQEQGP